MEHQEVDSNFISSESMEHQEVDGKDMQVDVLTNIAQRLTDMDDFSAFRLTATRFKKAAPLDEFKGLYLRRNVPYLMLPSGKNDGTEHEFYSLAKGKVVQETTSQVGKGKKRIESQGWLLIFGRHPERSITLVNPFKDLEIGLPDETAVLGCDTDLDETHMFTIRKMALSSRPHDESSDFALLVIYGFQGYLGFWKAGNQKWIAPTEIPTGVVDVTFWNNRFFSIDSAGCVWAFDFEGPDSIMASHVVSLPFGRDHSYIVSSSGMLLVILWRPMTFHAVDDDFYDDGEFADGEESIMWDTKLICKHSGFDIFEVNPETKSWEQIDNLGGKALFIGTNSASLLIDSTRGIKANHIYCAGIASFQNGGAWVYNVQDGNREQLNVGNSSSPMYPPLWLAPSF